MSCLARIEDLISPPVVGERYLVPALGRGGAWIPTLGPVHADPELGVPELHLHYDVRFLTDAEIRCIGASHARQACSAEQALAHILPVQFLATALLVGVLVLCPSDEGPVHRPMRCARQMPQYEPAHAHAWLAKLERAYAGARVTEGRCPHRGLPLRSMPQRDGKVVCPGHGLCWRIEDGHLLPVPPEVHAEIQKIARLLDGMGRGQA